MAGPQDRTRPTEIDGGSTGQDPPYGDRWRVHRTGPALRRLMAGPQDRTRPTEIYGGPAGQAPPYGDLWRGRRTEPPLRSREIVMTTVGITSLRRGMFAALGVLCVALGIIGVFLPGLPTTEFIIAASYLFARSSPAAEAWLERHRWLGPPLRRFKETRSE